MKDKKIGTKAVMTLKTSDFNNLKQVVNVDMSDLENLPEEAANSIANNVYCKVQLKQGV